LHGHGQRPGRGTPCASFCLLALAASLAGAGTGAASAPARLVDGSRPPAVPPALRFLHGRLVMTKVRVVPLGRVRSLAASCDRGERLPADEPVVLRVGASGASVTFAGLYGAVYGCDRNPAAAGAFWCGTTGYEAVGRRLPDPRLTVCQDGRGRPLVGFAWLVPAPGMRWLVVDQPGFREVYERATGLPMRVATTAGLGPSSATIRYSGYDERGRLVLRRTLTTAIAG